MQPTLQKEKSNTTPSAAHFSKEKSKVTTTEGKLALRKRKRSLNSNESKCLVQVQSQAQSNPKVSKSLFTIYQIAADSIVPIVRVPFIMSSFFTFT